MAQGLKRLDITLGATSFDALIHVPRWHNISEKVRLGWVPAGFSHNNVIPSEEVLGALQVGMRRPDSREVM